MAARLTCAVKDCHYGEYTDNQIRKEILYKCTSTYSKRTFLEGHGLTLANTLEIAENCEKFNTQCAAMREKEKIGSKPHKGNKEILW